MRLLELFSGSKSVSKAVGHLFDEVVSIDVMKEYNPTICVDVLNWDYTIYAPGYFTIIWASPPCQDFSMINNSRPDKISDLDLADSLVLKTIEIIKYFKPEKFFIENPQTGELRNRSYMDCIPYVDLDYCQFSDWGYRKRTRIWTCENKQNVLCNANCKNKIGNRHKHALGNRSYKEYREPGIKRILTRYRIPEKLIAYLFE